MENTQSIFETCTTSPAVKGLVLFTDSSKQLVELRDSIYNEFIADSLVDQDRCRLPERMTRLFIAAAKQYCREIADDCQHIKSLNAKGPELIEYCAIYANRFQVIGYRCIAPCTLDGAIFDEGQKIIIADHECYSYWKGTDFFDRHPYEFKKIYLG